MSGLSQQATVTWKDPDGNDISDGADYTVNQGTWLSENQESVLTITQAKLENLKSNPAQHIFTCSVKSGEYPVNSPDVEKTMTLTILPLSKYLYPCVFRMSFLFKGLSKLIVSSQQKCITIFQLMFNSDVEAISKEVQSDQDATISCVISDLTQQLTTIVWKNNADTDVATLGGNYEVVEGTFNTDSQTTVLTVKAAANTADAVFTCVVSSTEQSVTDLATGVNLKVYCKCNIHNN